MQNKVKLIDIKKNNTTEIIIDKMIKKMYLQPVTKAVPVHTECALMTYSKIRNSEDEAIIGIRDEDDSTEIEVN